MKIINTCMGHIGENGRCEVCGEVSLTSSTMCGKVTETEAPYYIHPLFGSGYDDGFKDGAEAFKHGIKALIEDRINELYLHQEILAKRGETSLFNNERINECKIILNLLDKVKPFKV